MSGNPGQFKDFNKTANDLLTKVFPAKLGEGNTYGVELELRPTKYELFTTKVTSTGTKGAVGEVGSEINLSDFGITFKSLFRTDKPTLETSWRISDKIPVDGLSAKLHFDATDKTQTAGVSVAYEHKWLTLNGRVQIPVTVQIVDFAKDLAGQDTKLDLDFVLKHPDYKFVLGGQGKVSLPQQGDRRLDEATLSLGFREGKLVAPSLVYTQKLEKGSDKRNLAVVVVSQPADTTYAVAAAYELGTKATAVTAGLSYPLNDGAVVKAKVNTAREVGLAYSKQLSASTKLDFGTLLALQSTNDRPSVDAAFALDRKSVV